MSTATLERTKDVTVAPVAPLTTPEVNSLITLSASTEKVATVRGGTGTRTSRGWSLGGNVD